MSKSHTLTVGFDIGGTHMRAGVVDEAGVILDFSSQPTPSTPEGLEKGVAEAVERLSRDHEVSAVGLAVAGFLDPSTEIVRFAPHLAWKNSNVRQILSDSLGMPVKLEHDANSAAWAEYQFGVARGVGTWVHFAIGTGIGATLMIDGQIYRGAYGTAPEFGHLRVVPDGRPCACGKSGCLERYCSGTGLVETAHDILSRQHFAGSAFEELFRADPDAITGRTVTAAAAQGDPAARAVVADFANWLGEGLSIVADVLDPELIVLGGGVAQAADLYLEDAKRRFAERIVGSGYRPLADIKTAVLGRDAGMIGVADLARRMVQEAQ